MPLYNFTDLELIDDCFDKLIAQGGCSTDSDGNCMYRGKGGRKCSVGVYMPDEQYTSDIEGAEVTAITKKGDMIRAIILPLGLNPEKMNVLQQAHDRCARHSQSSNRPEVVLLEEMREYLKLRVAGQSLESIEVFRFNFKA